MRRYLFKAKDVIDDTGKISDINIMVVSRTQNGAFNRALNACYHSDIAKEIDLNYYDLEPAQKQDLISRKLQERKKDITFIGDRDMYYEKLPKTISSTLIYH